MKITLIISVYKDVDALRAVLRSVEKQTCTNFEVIVSQDADDACFDTLIREFQPKFPIKHLQQPDTGFLKNQLLNRTIREAKSDRMVFIDGDCVIHPRFLEQYAKHIQLGRICMGRRIDLDAFSTAEIKAGKRIYPRFWQMIKYKTKRVEEVFYLPNLPQFFHSKPKLLGCNMGWMKSDLIRLNGFDEDYQFPGYGEDTDIEWRAKKAGMVSFSVRYKCIQFHLDHARPDREGEVSKSRLLFESRKDRSDFRCQNGLEKLG